MRAGRLPLGLAGLGAVVALTAAVAWWPRGPSGADADDAELVALGRQVYAAHCAECHGADLRGETPDWRQRKPNGRLPAPPHDESGHTWHHGDAQLFAITKHGVAALVGGGYESDMPAYDGVLSDREIWAVLAYIKSTWPDRIRRVQEQRTAAAD